MARNPMTLCYVMKGEMCTVKSNRMVSGAVGWSSVGPISGSYIAYPGDRVQSPIPPLPFIPLSTVSLSENVSIICIKYLYQSFFSPLPPSHPNWFILILPLTTPLLLQVIKHDECCHHSPTPPHPPRLWYLPTGHWGEPLLPIASQCSNQWSNPRVSPYLLTPLQVTYLNSGIAGRESKGPTSASTGCTHLTLQ